MNKKNDIKIRSVQSLVQRAINNIEKEMENGYARESSELVLAREHLKNAIRVLWLLHQGATCLSHPPAEFQVMQVRPVKTPGYVAAQLGLATITIDCEVQL
jgi:hypothetical protein